MDQLFELTKLTNQGTYYDQGRSEIEPLLRAIQAASNGDEHIEHVVRIFRFQYEEDE